jgi:hypothetical protein
MTPFIDGSYSDKVARELQEHVRKSQKMGFWSQNGEEEGQSTLIFILVIFVMYSR